MSNFFDHTNDLRSKKTTQSLEPAGPRTRPTGLSILIAVTTVVALLFGAVAAFTLAVGLNRTGPNGAAVFLFGLILLITPILFLIFAFGAWKLKPWAWYLGLVAFGGNSIVIALRLLFGTAFPVEAVILVLQLIALVYLFRPSVRASFGSLEPVSHE